MILQFDPFESTVDAGFWESLVKNKIEVYKLNDSPVKITAFYEISKTIIASNTNEIFGLPTRMSVGFTALEAPKPPSHTAISCTGTMTLTNTLSEFRDIDKNRFLKGAALSIWAAILDGSAVENPQLLTCFALLLYADIKKFKFYYWFAFPALFPPVPFKTSKEPVLLSTIFTLQECALLGSEYEKFKSTLPQQAGFFLVKKNKDSFEIAPLSNWSQFWKDSAESITVGFLDPSSQSSSPGWPLRNFLLLIQKQWKVPNVAVIALRGNVNDSLYFNVEFDLTSPLSNELPGITGWEKGTSGKLTPRLVDLGPMMDPKRLAHSAVDLNLKLMRWRILPSLNLESISNTKCLLLGAGTLGCYVARMLLAWGVRNITFVDNGKVSFSNPVRQPLFTFQDCLEGGVAKAKAAASSLEAIFPGVHAKGIDLSIPMPGHSIDSSQVISERIAMLKKLMEEHDAIFLLTDSRESRWLPTVLGSALQKIVINTALGFDSFLVVRHGYRNLSIPPKEKLGCYFCNDVVAPSDSLSDRTLDQQCTVTRPGLSGLASAIAVEMLASILNHPDQIQAPADSSDSSSSTPLGIVPHQVRGFLASFSNMVLTGKAYDKCTACSDAILTKYAQDGTAFLLKALADPAYIELVSGLTEMKKVMDQEDQDLEWDEEDEMYL